jgi:PAS domain S-box-containing protein
MPPGPDPAIPLETVRNAFRGREDPREPLTAADVAHALDCSRRTAYAKLQRLVDRGDLATKKVGARGRVWWPRSSADVAAPAGASTEAQERNLLERLLETSPVGIAVLDPNGRIRRANSRAENLLGLERLQIEGRTYDDPDWDILDEAGAPITPADHPVNRVLETGEPVFGFTHVIRRPDGSRRWLSSNSAPVFDDEGAIERVVVALEDVTALKAQEQRIRRQHDDLAYLDRINEIIRSVDRGIVAATTREGIEQAVCNRLVAAEPYQFAVVGQFSGSREAFLPRTTAGDGHLDDSRCRSPWSADIEAASRAARTREVQTVADAGADATDARVTDTGAYGYQSYVAVPLVYEDVVYGVLGVYADSHSAFEADERTILGELGESVGHAINALERKQALLADTVVQLRFSESGSLASLVESAFDDTEGRGVLERTVLLGGDDAVQFYTWVGPDPGPFVRSIEQLAPVEHVRVVRRDDESARLEVRTSGPTVASVFAAFGGRLARTRLEDGTLEFLAEFPYETDVRQVVDAVTDLYPDIRFLSRRTRTHPERTPGGFRDGVLDRLTERQRTVLELSYGGGFYDWPRESTGEQLARAMGVAPSTFHKHLRRGHRTLLAVLFGPTDLTDR